jgi:hypothetical protein
MITNQYWTETFFELLLLEFTPFLTFAL